MVCPCHGLVFRRSHRLGGVRGPLPALPDTDPPLDGSSCRSLIPDRVSVAEMRKTCPVAAFRQSPRFSRANASPLSANCSARRFGSGYDKRNEIEVARATEPEARARSGRAADVHRRFHEPSGSSTRPHRTRGRQHPETEAYIHTRSLALYRIVARRLGSPTTPQAQWPESAVGPGCRLQSNRASGPRQARLARIGITVR